MDCIIIPNVYLFFIFFFFFFFFFLFCQKSSVWYDRQRLSLQGEDDVQTLKESREQIEAIIEVNFTDIYHIDT